uniref:Cadherin domain-containing protein n=1 Tax=Astyanax mexicanus TaxID=7994 RepID=W5KPU3_ASTMX
MTEQKLNYNSGTILVQFCCYQHSVFMSMLCWMLIKSTKYQRALPGCFSSGVSRIIQGLRRRKREWVIPPIAFPENHRGPFPKEIGQIRSAFKEVIYSITGEGADQPPVGLFTINKNTGWLSVTKALDRETKHKYIQAHAVEADGELKEEPMEMVIIVIDQNDNKPIFTQNPFLGSVPESSTIVEFMTVTATDEDDPETDNAKVRYSIISQDPPQPSPNMFIINSTSGGITVNSDGLDREVRAEIR